MTQEIADLQKLSRQLSALAAILITSPYPLKTGFTSFIALPIDLSLSRNFLVVSPEIDFVVFDGVRSMLKKITGVDDDDYSNRNDHDVGYDVLSVGLEKMRQNGQVSSSIKGTINRTAGSYWASSFVLAHFDRVRMCGPPKAA